MERKLYHSRRALKLVRLLVTLTHHIVSVKSGTMSYIPFLLQLTAHPKQHRPVANIANRTVRFAAAVDRKSV
jgi:hypothetical protein